MNWLALVALFVWTEVASANSMVPVLMVYSILGAVTLPAIILIEGFIYRRKLVPRPFKLALLTNLISSIAGIPFSLLSTQVMFPSVAMESEVAAMLRDGNSGGAIGLIAFSILGFGAALAFNLYFSTYVEQRSSKMFDDWKGHTIEWRTFFMANRITYGLITLGLIGSSAAGFVTGSIYRVGPKMEKRLDIELTKFIETKMTGLRILELKDLSEDARAPFLSSPGHSEPGKVCVGYAKIKRNCLLILADKKTGDIAKIVVVDQGIGAPKTTEVENWERSKGAVSDVYVLPMSKKEITVLKEPSGKVQMTSDGFEVIFFEKSSFVVYFNKGKLERVWTSD